MKPGAVVAAVPADQGNLPGLTWPAGENFPSPAGSETQIELGDEQMKREGFLVRENHIGKTVLVDVGKAQPVVAALSVHEGRVGRQRKRQPLPGLLLFGPGKDRVLRFIGDDEFAAPVAIHVAQTRAAVPKTFGGAPIHS